MDEQYQEEQWRSEIVAYYFDIPNDTTVKLNPPSLQRRASALPTPSASQNGMLTAPPLEKNDSQWSPMSSSGLATPQDSLNGYCSTSPDRRRSGRFSLDSNGFYGHSNRWSLGTQLSNVSFNECKTCCMLSLI